MPSKLSNLFVGLGCLTPIVGVVLLFYFLFQSSFLHGFISVIVSLVVTIIFFILVSQIEEQRKIKQLEFLQTFQPDLEEFHKLKSFTSYDLLTKIAIDEQQRKVYFWVPESNKGENVPKAYVGMPYVIKSYNYSEILAINLTEDHYQTDSVQKDTHFTQFLLNKLNEEDIELRNASNPPVDKISSMDLEIIVNDNLKPRHLIRFYHAPYVRIRKDSPEYQTHFSERQQWFSMLQAIILETEQSATTPKIEHPMETHEPSFIEETLQESSSKETTHITIDVDTERYSLRLHEEAKDPAADNSQKIPDDDVVDQAIEKPLSYFDQLIEKNRRQMRGDYNED